MDHPIRRSMQCFVCGKPYQNPVVLPCGLSVCKRHTENKRHYTCPNVKCRLDHAVPVNGFTVNQTIRNLQDRGANAPIPVGNEYAHAAQECRRLKDRIKNFKNVKDSLGTEIVNQIITCRDQVILIKIIFIKSIF